MYFARKQVAGAVGCERLKQSSVSIRCRQPSSIDLKKTGHVQNVTCACSLFIQLRAQPGLDPALSFMQPILDRWLDGSAPRAQSPGPSRLGVSYQPSAVSKKGKRYCPDWCRYKNSLGPVSFGTQAGRSHRIQEKFMEAGRHRIGCLAYPVRDSNSLNPRKPYRQRWMRRSCKNRRW